MGQMGRGFVSMENCKNEFLDYSSFSQLLAEKTYQFLSKIHLHHFWAAACLLHPGVRSFSSAIQIDKLKVRRNGECLLLLMIEAFCRSKTDEIESPPTLSNQPRSVAQPRLRKDKFQLKYSLSIVRFMET